jgi:hypothetical protein
MRQFLLPFILAAISLSSIEIAKQEDCGCSDPKPLVCYDPCAPNSRLQMGVNYTWTNISPEGLSSTTGNLGGLQALYEYRAPKTVYAGLWFAWRQGNTTGGNGSERSLCYIDVEERIGYSLHTVCDCWDCSLFTGFGYRHHGEDATAFTGADTVTFDYNQFYVPAGFALEGRINTTLSMGVNFEWMPQVYPTVKIDPLDGARWILTAELANFRLGIPLYLGPQNREWFVNIEPFFEYWQDGATTAVTPSGLALAIPQVTYSFAGINLNAGFSF